MSSKPILYYLVLSPPARACALTAAALGVELELKNVNLLERENLKPDFLKMNPQHTIPVLDDNGTIIVDSHVICGYLVDKYGKNDKLYPKDVAKRALVDARLYYDACNVFSRIRFLFEPIFYEKWTKFDEWRLQYIEKLWEVVDRFVLETSYVCGNEMTIADLCLVATISSIDEIVRIDSTTYPNLTKWYKRMHQLPYYQHVNGVGAKSIQQVVRDALINNAKSL